MECPEEGHGPMNPVTAVTVTGMGVSPRIVRVGYLCASCGRKGKPDKPEPLLTEEERAVWERK
jgi:hypothetical protein